MHFSSPEAQKTTHTLVFLHRKVYLKDSFENVRGLRREPGQLVKRADLTAGPTGRAAEEQVGWRP